ncbi:MAG: GNAT family N-acetyltransferase [Candidatus Thorarchaeota archaeon]|nr:GNAT family N-acetyltransferase [Candidatus Thorarchaeota archaeon]
MAEKYTRDKIRDFVMTIDDAAKLADCFNSFDDSDSWPGGFTGGIQVTAQSVLERKEKSDDIRTIVAIDGDKIVGHCNLCHAELDREGAYVGLLGVRPDYQGKGYGKAMLIAATETAAQHGKRRIDLHTWGGNLKAMPLYKRIGFNWVPDTRVLMESYIPCIITTPLFEEFFQRHYWYESIRPTINQVPDEYSRNGIGVYEYHFEGNNGDRLDVTIDRYAKGICGFVLTIDGKTIEATVMPESQIGYIAVGTTPVRLHIKNKTEENIQASVVVRPSEKLRALIEGPTQVNIGIGEETEIIGGYEILPSAKPHSVSEPYVKVKTWAQWTLRIEDKSVDMFSGIIPKDAVTFSTGPDYPSVSPGERAEIEIQLENNTPEQIKGRVVLAGNGGHNLSWHLFEFEIGPKDTIMKQLEVETSTEDTNSVISIDTAIYIQKEDSVRIKDTAISVVVLGTQGAVVYESCSTRAVLETEQYRLEFGKGPLPYVETIEYKTVDRIATGWMLTPQIGYPFPEGGEWLNREYHPIYNNHGDTAEIIFEGDSKDRPGLRVQFVYRAHAGSGELEFIVRLENLGVEPIENLGLNVENWASLQLTKLYVPLNGKIYSLSDSYWGKGGQLPDKPQYYHEDWFVATDEEAGYLLGAIWEHEGIVRIKPQRSVRPPQTEYKFRDLQPGESIEQRVIRLYFTTGTWRDIRDRWAKLNGKTIANEDPIKPHSSLEVTFAASTGWIQNMSPALTAVDRAVKDWLKLQVSVIQKDPISATAHIRPPAGILFNGERELTFKFEASIDQPFEKEIETTVEDGPWLREDGEIVIEFPNRIARFPLRTVCYDSTDKIQRSREEYQELSLHTIRSGGYRLSVSPEQAGGLVAYGPENGPSVFYDTFPELRPFAWLDILYSGMTPFVAGHHIWDWQTSLRRETWSVEEIERGPLVGYRIMTTLRHAENVQGVHLSYDYLLLKGTPLVNVIMTIENRGKRWRICEAGLVGVPASGVNESDRLHFVRLGQRTIYEPTPNGVHLIPDASSGWFAFERPNGEVLCVASTCKTRGNIIVNHTGEAGHFLMLSDKFRLRSGQKAKRSWWLLHGTKIDNAILIKDMTEPRS